MSLFQVPPRTKYDLNFTLLGIPVQVHPLFWVLTILLGASSGSVIYILIWIIVVFVSILIHEMGHSLMMRTYGQESYVVLHVMGGLAVPISSRWGSQRDRTPIEQIFISLAGPFAGFLLATFVLAGVAIMGGSIKISWFLGFLPLPNAWLFGVNQAVNVMISMLLWVNVFWSLINLMPTFPLDGGQVARQLFIMFDPWDGVRKSLWLSVISGAMIAIIGWVVLNSTFMALLFLFLALQSYQMLHGGGSRF